jgi:ABC-type Fe3+-hydroxamate transport system substrate-binding protein
MTDTFDQYLEDDPNAEQPMVQMPRKDARRLAKAAKAGREAQEQLAQFERERAFVQAGVPITDKRAAYFIAGYQGEQTPEAIQAEWTAAFGESNTGADPAIADEMAAMNSAQDLVNSGGSELSESRLAERNAKLAQISPTDPRAPEKFDAIFQEYGGQMAAQHTATGPPIR